MLLGAHAFQMAEMCQLFGGYKLQLAFTVTLMSYNFFSLCGHCALFGNGLATYAPLPFLGEVGSYRMYVLLFSIVMVPLSTMEIKEQAGFQVRCDGINDGDIAFFAAILFPSPSPSPGESTT